ncbi:hypothetical protein GGS24DRAFT_440620 [Hypoxylon argillaceum]|nr:hypothetical protein GGS24DRAFT_440620 [Hypoxylon argillaceum]
MVELHRTCVLVLQPIRRALAELYHHPRRDHWRGVRGWEDRSGPISGCARPARTIAGGAALGATLRVSSRLDIYTRRMLVEPAR